MICIISAIGEGGVIGTGKGLPWDIPEEYNKFLNHVRGNTVIMGRVSWEIFGADLPETRFIVVSRGMQEKPGVIVATSVWEAVAIAQEFPEPVFIAGGSQIYEEGLKYADRMYLSFIKGKHEGNRYFPEIDSLKWRETKSIDYPEFVYKEYSRIGADTLLVFDTPDT